MCIINFKLHNYGLQLTFHAGINFVLVTQVHPMICKYYISCSATCIVRVQFVIACVKHGVEFWL